MHPSRRGAEVLTARILPLLQLGGGLLCALPAAWSTYAYVAHTSDEVTWWMLARWFLVSISWGPLWILLGGLLALIRRRGRVGAWLGVLGAIPAIIVYGGGVWVLTFRFPAHWTLYGMEALGALGALLALFVGVAQIKSRNKGTAEDVAPDEARS